MIEKNIGIIDRGIRLVISLALIYFAAVVVRGYWGILLAVIAGFVINAVIDGY